MEDLLNLLQNFGSSIFLLCYFVYKDNKFTSSLDVTLKTLQTSVNSLEELIKEGIEKNATHKQSSKSTDK